jgi:sigma-B regulation protein RsbU (phosphoserine phosphatase)
MTKILIVDRSRFVRNLIKKELMDLDAETIEADSGEEALEKIVSLEPDLITLSVEMPGINGYETCRQLRQNSQLTQDGRKIAEIPVIFITAKDTLEGRRLGFEAGATDFVLKPFKPGAVLELAVKLLEKKSSVEGMRILVVEDSNMVQKVIALTLKQAGLNVIQAYNGKEALDIIEQSEGAVDAVITDCEMPVMGGIEFCQTLRMLANYKDIPVLFLSAQEKKEKILEMYRVGASDYLSKPFAKEELIQRLFVHLNVKVLLDKQKRHFIQLQHAYELIEAQKKRMQGELDVGREIQMSMLPLKFPPFPERDEVGIFASLTPAREVSGDFYDFFFINQDRLCFLVGDVSGKGVPSALFMVKAKTLIETKAKQNISTSAIISYVNDELCRDNDTSMFVTVFIGILDVASGLLEYTNAGHNPPYLRYHDGVIKSLDDRHGPVVGALSGLDYQQNQISMSNNDLLFLYTDGVTEAENADNQMFSDERLGKLIASLDSVSAEEIVGTIQEEIKAFEKDVDQSDDITMLAIQFLH